MLNSHLTCAFRYVFNFQLWFWPGFIPSHSIQIWILTFLWFSKVKVLFSLFSNCLVSDRFTLWSKWLVLFVKWFIDIRKNWVIVLSVKWLLFLLFLRAEGIHEGSHLRLLSFEGMQNGVRLELWFRVIQDVLQIVWWLGVFINLSRLSRYVITLVELIRCLRFFLVLHTILTFLACTIFCYFACSICMGISSSSRFLLELCFLRDTCFLDLWEHVNECANYWMLGEKLRLKVNLSLKRAF